MAINNCISGKMHCDITNFVDSRKSEKWKIPLEWYIVVNLQSFKDLL